MRSHHGLAPFKGDESDYADFTIVDPITCGKLAECLAGTNTTLSQPTSASAKPDRYHIEVKATTGDHDEPFEMSSNQFRLVSVAMQFHRYTGLTHLRRQSSSTIALPTRCSSSASTT
jgi:hypothetical protein